MTTSAARHRKAARPLTPISSFAPASRRGLAVAASSGLVLTMITSGANAAGSIDASASAGSLEDSGVGLVVSQVRDAAATNDVISTGSVTPAADVSTVAAVSVQAPAAPEPTTADQNDAEQTDTAATTTAASSEAAPAVSVSANGSDVVSIALQYQGAPYLAGGNTPAGWDCSGFVQYVYAQVGISLPHSASAQAAAGTLVSADQAQPGDLVYYGYHVGIYVGDGMMIDAGTSATGTVYRAVWGSPIGYIHIG